MLLGDLEQATVDVRERRQVARLVLGILGIQGVEQVGQELLHVRPVGLGVRPYRGGELLVGEDPGVLSEEAEQQSGEEHVQRMAAMLLVDEVRVRLQELVEELAHALGGLDVGVRLGGVLRLLHPGPGRRT